MQAEWTGRTVIVTGASGNLGAAVARAFAAGGANLVLVDRHLEALQRAGFADDATHLLSVTDLLDQTQVSAMVQAAVGDNDAARETFSEIVPQAKGLPPSTTFCQGYRESSTASDPT